jgi:phosphohistidine phosphatase
VKTEKNEADKSADDSGEEYGRVIVLVRHGAAEDARDQGSDAERELTDEGHARMKLTARGIAAMISRPSAIVTSPLVRSQQTARWVSRAWRGRPEPDTADILAPGADPVQLESFVRSLPGKRTVLIGHEPDLSILAERLIGIREHGAMRLGKGGACAIVLEGGTAKLEWLMTPRALRTLGSR